VATAVTTDEIYERYLRKAITEINRLSHEVAQAADGAPTALPTGHPLASIFLLKYGPQAPELQEGVASEAASLAGHLKLGKLIYLYDDNQVTLSAGTDITFTEDRARRFEAYGWHARSVEDGNDLVAIDDALRAARAETMRPSLILVRTHLGYGSPDKQDTFEAHGSPLGVDEVRSTKRNLGWPEEPPFLLPEPALAHAGNDPVSSALRARRSRNSRSEIHLRFCVTQSRLAVELSSTWSHSPLACGKG